MMLSLKVVKIDWKISNLLCYSKSVTHSVVNANKKMSKIIRFKKSLNGDNEYKEKINCTIALYRLTKQDNNFRVYLSTFESSIIF